MTLPRAEGPALETLETVAYLDIPQVLAVKNGTLAVSSGRELVRVHEREKRRRRDPSRGVSPDTGTDHLPQKKSPTALVTTPYNNASIRLRYRTA